MKSLALNKSKLSLRRMQFGRRLITGTICLTIIAVSQFFVMDDFFMHIEKYIMKSSAEEIATLDFSAPDYKARISDIEASHNFYIEIYSPRDQLVYTSDSNRVVYEHNSEELEEQELSPRIMKFISRTEYNDGSYVETRQEYYTTAQYLVFGSFFNENSGVEIYSSVDALKEHALIASYVILAFAVFISVSLSIIAEVYIRIFTKPLIILNDRTKKITNMDFSKKCPDFKIAELDELSENINSLSDSLNKALITLKNENLQLERDIEVERRTEKIMRTFIANASHELKTPISIIQAYAEGMKYGIGCDSPEQFSDIIIDETQKMNNLVVRLMEYLHYGSETYKLNRSTFNLRSLITENLEMQKKKIENAQANLSVDINEKLMCNGDTEMILTVFNNYLSNALSHLDFERNINVTAKDMGDRCTVSIFNSGKPIPGTDIENIWQSFYRADKAHSRSEGRFGLGLSIVSTIQKLHEQKCGVVNFEKGVEFWFDIKKVNN